MTTQMLGKYSVHDTISKGSFSRVRHCVDTTTNTSYALRIIDRQKIEEEGLLDSLKNEITIMKMFNHRSVVTVVNMMASTNRIFLVLDLMTAGNMKTKLQAEHFLDENEAMFYFQQFFAGVEYLHSMGITHGNLRLENILLHANGSLKITDFSMSTILDQVETDHKSQTEDIDDYVSTYSATNTSVTSKFQTLRSSPQYMAPEVIDDCCIDSKKAEIWSMGVILFGMTTGDLPFGAIDDMRSSHAAPLRHPSFYSFALPHKGEDLGPDSTIDILERIKTSQKKPYPDWISKELMVLLNGMLVGNPYKRYSLYDIKASDWMDALPEESEQPLRHDIIVPKRPKHPKTAERSYFSFVECLSVFSSCDPFPKTPIVTSEDCDQSLPDDGVLYKADSSSTIAGNDMLNGFSGMGRLKQRPLSYNNSKPFLVGRSYSGQQSPASPNYGSSNYNSPRGSIRVSPRNSPSDIQKDKEAIRRFSFSKVIETETLRRESLKNGSLSRESSSTKAPLFAQEPSPPRVPVQMKVLSPPKRPFPPKIPNQVREPSTKKVPVLPKEPALYRPTLSKEPSLTKLPPREPSTPPNVPKLTKEPSLTKIPKEPSPTKLTRENSSTKIPLTREGSSSRMTNITRENSSSRIALTRESSLSKIPPLTKIPSMKDSSTKEVILMAQMMMAQRLELESQNELNQEQD